MKRRVFFKSAAFAGLASVFSPKVLGSTNASSVFSANSIPDLVAIMGGEPEAMLLRAFKELGGIGYVSKGDKVVIKPNIGWGKMPELAANTNPELVGALAKWCPEMMKAIAVK